MDRLLQSILVGLYLFITGCILSNTQDENGSGGEKIYSANNQTNTQHNRDEKMEEFVRRALFQGLLRREPNATELNQWTLKLKNADPACTEIPLNFFDHYAQLGAIEKGIFLDRLYRGLLNREPDPGGAAYWMNRQIEGKELLEHFIAAGNEYKNICQNLESQTINDGKCYVRSQQDVQRCFNQAKSGATSHILFKTMVSCESCQYSLTHYQGRGLLVEGSLENRVAGLKRQKHYYSLSDVVAMNHKHFIDASNSKNITFKNLTLEDHTCDFLAQNQIHNYCKVILLRANLTDNVKVQGSNLFGSQFAISYWGSKNIEVTGSVIQQAKFFGIWFGFELDNHNNPIEHSLNDGAIIANNLFYHNYTNAILVSGRNIKIFDNIFDHNHHTGVFYTCNGPCPGGQLLMEKPLENVEVTRNLFEHASMPGSNTRPSGIEFHATNTLPSIDVTIAHNKFYDIDGYAIYFNSGSREYHNLEISNNCGSDIGTGSSLINFVNPQDRYLLGTNNGLDNNNAIFPGCYPN